MLISISPCPGRDFISLQTRKETKQRNAFKPPIFKCRRCPFQVFGTNVARPPSINAQSDTHLKHRRRTHASPRQPYIGAYPCPRITRPGGTRESCFAPCRPRTNQARTARFAADLDAHVVASSNAQSGPPRRSVCAPLVLEEGVQLRVKYLWPHYVRAKNLKWSNDDTYVLAV